MPKYVPSKSQRALDRILSTGGELADRIKASKIHGTNLSEYRRARGKPSAATIALLAQLSDGEIPADGWATSEPDVDPTTAADADPAPSSAAE